MYVILPMIFIVAELLSMIFGHTFAQFTYFGFTFNFIVGVIYFCFGFWILDMITEIYDTRLTNKVIFGKIICQILFVLLMQIGILFTKESNQLVLFQKLNFMPKMIFSSAAASIFGYKLTAFLMQYLKIRYNGRFITIRYLVSTLPGEFAFSFIYCFIFLFSE